jgi:putative hemolysin
VNNSALEILVILVLLIANGVFAMSEIAIVASRKARLQQWVDEGKAGARAALALANNPTQFLATVQTGITLVGILAGAFSGATIAEKLGAYLETVPVLAPYGQAIAVGVVVVLITYFSLIIGELAPKRLALNGAERIAVTIAAPMQLLSKAAAPIVHFISVSTDVVIRLLGVTPSTEPAVTEEEIKVLIEQGTQVGVFEESEQDMIEGVLSLSERRVSILMVPRTQVDWIDIEDPPERIKEEIITYRHSVFPLAKDNLDNIIGIVYAKDLLAQTLSGHPLDLKALLQHPLFVPEKMPALQVLELFKQKGVRIAFVVDEFGSIQGMVTDDDILEDIVGDIPSIGSPAELKAVRREDGSWLLDGLLHIDELKEVLGIEELPDEKEGYYQTAGGFVINQIGTIPTVGQSFKWGDFRFEVVDMDGRRVDKVLALPIPTKRLPQ